ncbi:MAG: glycerol acyltransferase [Deltaproteobacteria bacterium]|nr:glycerol acyltransferase [Deltaproteobacteria bacterium]
MRHTVFNTPVLKHIMLGISLFFIKILGWKKAGRLPDEKKFVVIVAPHTSNWDVFYGAILAFAFRLDPCFIAKKELFRMPFGPLMKLLGGMPVNRDSKSHTVEQITNLFHKNENLILGIAPEGTRHKTTGWKSGFYHIAAGAHVPIVLAFIDYSTKTGGAGPLIYPSGDLERDMQKIGAFYSNVKGKYPDKASPVVIRPKS